jgi:hypothetical protein
MPPSIPPDNSSTTEDGPKTIPLTTPYVFVLGLGAGAGAGIGFAAVMAVVEMMK